MLLILVSLITVQQNSWDLSNGQVVSIDLIALKKFVFVQWSSVCHPPATFLALAH